VTTLGSEEIPTVKLTTIAATSSILGHYPKDEQRVLFGEANMVKVNKQSGGGEKMGKFSLGAVLVTRGVSSRIASDEAFSKFVISSLARHINGDWGDLCEWDKQENERAVQEESRILSAYRHNDDKIWIITEGDRSATTILFPEEY